MRGPFTAMQAVEMVEGLTYRRVDHWHKTGLVVPSVREGQQGGKGYGRLYSEQDIAKLRVVMLLRHAGLEMGAVRRAMESRSLAGVLELVLEGQRELIEIKESDRIAVGG